jgi:hypothetical protein
MPEKRRFSITALILILLVIGALVGVLYAVIPDALMANLPVIGGSALAAALVLWLLLQWQAGAAIEQAAASALAAVPAAKPAPAPATPPPAPVETKPAPPPPPVEPDETPAIQLLAILQRKGRLVDFLQEDLSAYADDQIGAAVRTIHEGCKQALAETMTLEPVMADAEGSTVTIPPGFDATAMRLTGNVSGEPPFRGTVQHRGWRVKSIDLPKRTKSDAGAMVVAAAEVEIG